MVSKLSAGRRNELEEAVQLDEGTCLIPWRRRTVPVPGRLA